jgi:hypothetical protein
MSYAFGEQNPTLGETAVSWQTWSDGAGHIPTIDGDPDWGKLNVDLSGEEGRSAVYDLGSSHARTFTLTENRYGTGGENAALQIRGHDSVTFLQDDTTPDWEDYSVPVSKNWRYIQVRETTLTYYYVDATGGDDGNTGLSPVQAWQTLARINTASLIPRSHMLFKRGEVWTGTTMLNAREGVTYADYGTGSLPSLENTDTGLYKCVIVSDGYNAINNVTIRNLKLIAHDNLVIELAGDAPGCSGWIIDGVESSGPISVYGSYNTVRNCIVYGTDNDGVPGHAGNGIKQSTSYSHHNTYYHNTVYNFSSRGIHLMNTCHDDVISYNIVHNIPLDGVSSSDYAIDVDGYGALCYRESIHHNVVYSCGNQGIGLENTFDSDIFCNILYSIRGCAIGIENYDTSTSAEGYGNGGNLYGYNMNNRVYCNKITGGCELGTPGQILIWYSSGNHILHNTLAYSTMNGIAFAGIGHTGTTNEVINNVIIEPGVGATGRRMIAVPSDSVADWSSLAVDDYNCLYRATPNVQYYTCNSPYAYKNIAQYQAVAGNGAKATHSIITDPGLIDQSGGNYHINSTSSNIYHTGVAGTGVVTDLDGVSFDASNPSMGCYEYI